MANKSIYVTMPTLAPLDSAYAGYLGAWYYDA